jgi:putative membrane protein
MNFPLLNAALNGTSAVLLVAGLVAIKGGRRELHERLMYTACATSAVFLASYLYYHFAIARGKPTTFNADGGARIAYLVLLGSHTILAMVNLPMILRTVYLARRERWDAHRRLAKITFPIWLYVSVTGVVVYVVLYHFNPPAA